MIQSPECYYVKTSISEMSDNPLFALTQSIEDRQDLQINLPTGSDKLSGVAENLPFGIAPTTRHAILRYSGIIREISVFKINKTVSRFTVQHFTYS